MACSQCGCSCGDKPNMRRRFKTDEVLSEVADIYRQNMQYAPTEAVAKAFHLKPRMASAYVAEARIRGFLPVTTQGKKRS